VVGGDGGCWGEKAVKVVDNGSGISEVFVK